MYLDHSSRGVQNDGRPIERTLQFVEITQPNGIHPLKNSKRSREWDGNLDSHAADVFNLVRACQASDLSSAQQFHTLLRVICLRGRRNIASRIAIGEEIWTIHPIELSKQWEPTEADTEVPPTFHELPPWLSQALSLHSIVPDDKGIFQMDSSNANGCATLLTDMVDELNDMLTEEVFDAALWADMMLAVHSILDLTPWKTLLTTFPSLEEIFHAAQSSLRTRHSGKRAGNNSEIETWFLTEPDENYGNHVLRYLQAILAHVTADASICRHPLFRKRVPIRAWLATCPADPHEFDVRTVLRDIKQELVELLPLHDSGSATFRSRLIRLQEGETFTGSVHAEATAIALVGAARDSCAPHTPLVGFDSIAFNLQQTFQVPALTTVRVAPRCCYGVAGSSAASSTKTNQVTLPGTHGVILPWAPPPGDPSPVLEELEHQLTCRSLQFVTGRSNELLGRDLDDEVREEPCTCAV
ncbi:hypothetical protein BV25DRAFT_1994766 [Artomyces pyxidatus]|uniref:Uncharacterized protein n=1 Tax=Artomyces pyxidatus TaxID=48021 RepID=A0ACB8SMX8_9AGAM|nr:hypothetical protein BV25DRAFT_1994766 [Artomyces pyxidatus]